MLTVKILVQAVVVTWAVLQQQGRWLALSGIMTPFDEVIMLAGIADLKTHGRVPTIGDGRKPWIKGRPKSGNNIRQRIAEVFVFTASKAVPRHNDAAAEKNVLLI